jgi:arsenite methyltransferase
MQPENAGTSPRRPRVLFLCTGNSCRSQMAEGWTRHLHPGLIEAHSAGTDPHGMNRLAVRAMAEAGIDISSHHSKRVQEIPDQRFDLVFTVCDAAHESCPTIPGARIVHAGFDDPPRLARGAPTDEDAMPHYRRVRDEIRAFIESLPATLPRLLTPSHEQPANGDPVMTSAPRSCCSDTCCTTASIAATATPDHDAVRETVREGYATIARGGACGSGAPGATSGGGCCGATTFNPDDLARAIGYSSSELAQTPDGANMGLSCGNPTAIASLKPGEVVLDLGAGGGFDCFIAGPKVGPTGRVIGVDMTPDMLSKARRNIASYTKQTGLSNVEFRLGEIESLPVADNSVDVVISNCVLNLSPDKPRVWREIARVLKPGGRVAVSDLALVQPLPDAVKADVLALIGCVAGAVPVEETRAMARAAGLVDVVLTPKPEYIDAMTNWEDPLYRAIITKLPAGSRTSDYITSLDTAARKP